MDFTRRKFLESSYGVGAIALASLLKGHSLASSRPSGPSTKSIEYPASGRRIFAHCAAAPARNAPGQNVL